MWNLFNNVGAMVGHRVVVGKAGIVKKVAFPRELLALSVGRCGAWSSSPSRWWCWWSSHAAASRSSRLDLSSPLLPLALVALIVFTGAVSIFLSAVNVYLRDTQHLTEVLLMAWFWGTPIVYTYGPDRSRPVQTPTRRCTGSSTSTCAIRSRRSS